MHIPTPRILRTMVASLAGFIAITTQAGEDPRPLVAYSFNEGSGTSSSPQNAVIAVPLQFSDPSTGPVSLFGPSGGGLSGKPGDYALDMGATTNGMGVKGTPGAVARFPVAGTAISGLTSFTISGWIRAASPLDGGARLVECIDPLQNGFLLMTSPGALVLSVNKKQTSSWAKTNGEELLRLTDTWVFFAVSYNGTKTSDNVVFYIGTQSLAPTILAVKSNDAGPVTALNRHGTLSVGNNSDGIRPFHGALDNIALHGSSVDATGALTAEQIKVIYNSARSTPLGPVIKPQTNAIPNTQGHKRQIALIGDSTVCNYPPESPLRGWGQILPEFLAPDVKVINEARGGLSSKTFPRTSWEKIINEHPLFVFIQFGHNDAHGAGKPESTDASTDYKDNLRRFITEARKAGITPILVTPPHRRLFYNGALTNELAPYAEAMTEVGSETHTAVIDLHAKTALVFENLGEIGSTAFTVNRTVDSQAAMEDRTHFTGKGARELARILAASFSSADSGLAKLLSR
ncbi:MAG: GDSL-type esterase/lipase family protein [Opitutaceae bacterium]|jgi:lysophospholipase L1-like esterase